MKDLIKFRTRKVDAMDVNTEELHICQDSFNKLGTGKVTETDLSFTKIGSETKHRSLNKTKKSAGKNITAWTRR